MYFDLETQSYRSLDLLSFLSELMEQTNYVDQFHGRLGQWFCSTCS